MNELLGKISSYHIFNHLLPGVLFVLILDRYTPYSLVQDNLIIAAFVYYFVGLVISRIGSLLIEPFFKKVSFLKFSNHISFLSASQKDPKMEVLLEISNMYRTLCSMFILLLLFLGYYLLELNFPELKEWHQYIAVVLLLSIFLFSYKKQTEYITKRIGHHVKESSEKKHH